MNQPRTSTRKTPSAQNAFLNEPERLLERAKQLVAGYDSDVNLYITINMGPRADSLNFQVDAEASLEDRCAVVDWFAKKLGARSGTGAPMLSESGHASYKVSAEFGANRPLYVDAWTQIAKSAR